MRRSIAPLILVLLTAPSACGGPGRTAPTEPPAALARKVPGTGQLTCFNDMSPIPCPSAGQPFFGQDGNADGRALSLQANADSTVTDLVTGLIWTRAVSGPLSWDEARMRAAALRTAGHTDWRVPTIKELYTLIDFGRGYFSTVAATSVPFLDTTRFDFAYATGERFFDVQLWSSTAYVGTTMNGDATVFGVNFADGRIKGYPRFEPGSNGRVPQLMRVRYVRGPAYGENRYVDQGNGTVRDATTGLTWQQVDDGTPRNWRDALAYCAALDVGGLTGWRLPNAKELHTIVDYTRAPTITGTAALAPPLRASTMESYYWSGTTIADGPSDDRYGKAVYFAFGRALGWMEMPPGSGLVRLLDVHGAGAQRADFKRGNPAQFPRGFGPQGDEVRITNFVRCVRG